MPDVLEPLHRVLSINLTSTQRETCGTECARRRNEKRGSGVFDGWVTYPHPKGSKVDSPSPYQTQFYTIRADVKSHKRCSYNML